MSENSTIKAKAKFFARRNTAAGWETKNPILGSGEIGAVTDSTDNSKRMKLGDGKTAWNDLPWITAGELKFNPESENAQSGLAVEEAIANKTLSIKGELGQLRYGQESGLYIIRKGTEISAQLKNGEKLMIFYTGIRTYDCDVYVFVNYQFEGKRTCFDCIYSNDYYLTAKRFRIGRENYTTDSGDIEKDVFYEEDLPLFGIATPDGNSPDNQAVNKEYVDKAFAEFSIPIDQTFDPTSPNAQSGIAMEQALKQKLAGISTGGSSITAKVEDNILYLTQSGNSYKVEISNNVLVLN